jgi:GTP-binding protein EngB required for normal cell division
MAILQDISTISANPNEIKENLPDATPEQIERFTLQVTRLHQVKDYFRLYREDINDFQDILAQAFKALNHTTPYRIAVIGRTGKGKSTLINALLGRSLVLKKDVGKPATGAALEIFFVEKNDAEIAIVTYRSEQNIRGLITEFFKDYSIREQINQLNSNFVAHLKNLEPPQSFNQPEQKDTFLALRNTLADMVDQFVKHPNLGTRTFDLNDSNDCEYLIALTDENSELNSQISPDRVISLIQTVTYKIHPNYQGFHLPKNVCLVDLLGLDGSPLHNIIIRDGIKDADAVIFIHQPQRVDTSDDLVLFNNIRRYITREESQSSYEGVFFVLNARDSITADRIPPELNTAMCELINNFLPHYTNYFTNRDQEGNPYFLISALAALEAQKSLKGEVLKDPNTYHRTLKGGLGLSENADDQTVLEASRLPQLVKKLMEFARDRRVERQISDGQTALNTIVESLVNKYNLEKTKLNRSFGQLSFEQQDEQILLDKETSLKKLVVDFRCEQSLVQYKLELTETAKIICTHTDKILTEKIPELWKESVERKRTPIKGKYETLFFPEKFLEGVQKYLWHELTERMTQLSDQLVRYYQTALKDKRIV